jgi:hypothetical protein
MRALVLLIAIANTACAYAQSTVYRNVDAEGKVTYSDQPARAGAAKVPKRVAPDLSAPAYDAAVNRTEMDRLYYERQRAEDQSQRPINVYDPRGGASTPGAATYAPSSPYYSRRRYDPNLPDSPPPSSERRYYYDGR